MKVRKVEENVNTNKLVVTTSERTRRQFGCRKGTEISRKTPRDRHVIWKSHGLGINMGLRPREEKHTHHVVWKSRLLSLVRFMSYLTASTRPIY